MVDLPDAQLATATWGTGTPEIVLLHDGLGSVEQWGTVPADLARLTGRTTLAYDRAGHGTSTPVPSGPWPPDWLHREADVLATLLHEFDAESASLVGHSDGGSIAAIHAARSGTGGPLVLLAAHSWVEPVCAAGITGMRRHPEGIIRGLGRYHAEPAALFEAWSGVWVSEAFAPWDIRPLLASVSVPALVVQGVRDEYATDAHAIETAAAIGPNADYRLLDGLGHLLHHRAPELVAELVAQFLDDRTRDRGTDGHSTSA